MAFKIKRFISASPLTMPDPKPIQKELSKKDILAKRYPGYVHRPNRDHGYSSTNKKGNPNEYNLYNPTTGDSMTVRPDFGKNK